MPKVSGLKLKNKVYINQKGDIYHIFGDPGGH